MLHISPALWGQCRGAVWISAVLTKLVLIPVNHRDRHLDKNYEGCKVIHVYFDGKCGLCSKEIRYYQKISPSAVFSWCDIAHDPAPLAPLGIGQADALRLLHAKDADGQLHIGVAAFILIWKQLHFGWRLLAVLAGLPMIKPILEAGYRRFAAYRFARLSHCQIAAERS